MNDAHLEGIGISVDVIEQKHLNIFDNLVKNKVFQSSNLYKLIKFKYLLVIKYQNTDFY